MKRLCISVAIAVLVLCGISYECYLRKEAVPAATSSVGAARVPYLLPYHGGYHYPHIPAELRISKGYGDPMRLLRTTKSRAEIVKWADQHGVGLVQNVGYCGFLLAKDIGSGLRIWVVYFYVLRNDKSWQLVHIGIGNVGGKSFDCAYYDRAKRTVRLSTYDGTVVGGFPIGDELDALKLRL